MADDETSAVQVSLSQRALSSCCGAIITSFFMTPLDVVKVRLQQQQPASSSVPSTSRLPSARRKLVTPLDVVKIRIQQQAQPMSKARCFLYSNGLMDHLCLTCAETTSAAPCEWYARPGRFTGTLDAFAKIARHEGIRSLWSGLSPTIVMAVPATVFYFSLYDHLLPRVRRRVGGSGNLWAPVIAGSSARLAAVTLISPLEMIRTKLQSERLSYKDVWRAVQASRRADGWSALWRGWGPTILRDLPFSALYWAGYEWLKKHLVRRFGLAETTFSISFVSGALSGAVAALLTLPFDVVKTHRQVAIGQTVLSGGKIHPSSTLAIMRNLVHERGLKSLFAGAVPRVVKIAPACAIMIGSYEYGKIFFERRNLQERERLKQ